MKKLTVLLGILMIAGATYACEGKSCCKDKKDCKKESKCCKDKKHCDKDAKETKKA